MGLRSFSATQPGFQDTHRLSWAALRTHLQNSFANRSHQVQLTCDPKAAGIKGGTLGGGDIDFEAEFLQGPAVGLCHILSGGSDVGLRHKQAPQAHVDVLLKQPRGKQVRPWLSLVPS